jgi:hypothetical protein
MKELKNLDFSAYNSSSRPVSVSLVELCQVASKVNIQNMSQI